jgi:two-component system LytT family response regulator
MPVSKAPGAASRIRALIVDDEPLARRRLGALAARDTRLTVVGECADGIEALEQIPIARPNLVFLDVQMPELSGFDVWDAVARGEHVPLVTFVTAYDTFAVRAFEIGAVDYLLKPFDDARFTLAIDRVEQAIGVPGRIASERGAVRRATSAYREAGKYLERIAVHVDGRVILLDATDVDWIEAAGNYLHLHTGSTVYRLREPITRFAQKLDPSTFMRVHRWHVVNLRRIVAVEPWAHGELVLRLRTGATIRASRTFARELRRVLRNDR